MKILLLGYGKMGKEIEAIALDRGHDIVGKISSENHAEINNYNAKNVDVAIEFSQPYTAFDNINYCLENNISIIAGTTGWLDQLSEIEAKCLKKKGTFLYASNFSIGVNLFFQLNEWLAKLMTSTPAYKVSMEEIHHTHKKDAPSGTAITLAEDILAINDAYKGWSLDKSDNDTIHIKAIRKDEVPGTHSIKYSTEIDEIEIKHTAHSRKGFALGAVLVAEWIKDKNGVLSMRDFLKDIK